MPVAPEPRSIAAPTLRNRKPRAAAQTTLAQQAAQMTNQQIAPQVAAYRQMQQDALRQAGQQAGQIGLASQAAANFVSSLGDKTAQDYAAAVAQQQGMAQGYSDQFRQATAAQGANLPQPLRIAAQGRGASLADLLYGLSGSLPADALRVQGLGATAAARAMPSTTLAYGQQQAVGALGAGRTAAAGFAPELAKVIASRPQVFQDTLGALSSAAEKRRQDQIGNAFKGISARQADERIAAERASAEALAAFRNRPGVHYGQYGAIYRTDPATGAVETLRPPDPKLMAQAAGYGPRMTTFHDATGTYSFNPYTGERGAKVGGPPASSVASLQLATAPDGSKVIFNPDTGETTPAPGKLGKPTLKGKLSVSQRGRYTGQINRAVANAFEGITADRASDGREHPKMIYKDAVNLLIQEGYFSSPALAKIARAALKKYYLAPAAGYRSAVGEIKKLKLFGDK